MRAERVAGALSCERRMMYHGRCNSFTTSFSSRAPACSLAASTRFPRANDGAQIAEYHINLPLDGFALTVLHVVRSVRNDCHNILDVTTSIWMWQQRQSECDNNVNLNVTTSIWMWQQQFKCDKQQFECDNINLNVTTAIWMWQQQFEYDKQQFECDKQQFECDNRNLNMSNSNLNMTNSNLNVTTAIWIQQQQFEYNNSNLNMTNSNLNVTTGI